MTTEDSITPSGTKVIVRDKMRQTAAVSRVIQAALAACVAAALLPGCGKAELSAKAEAPVTAKTETPVPEKPAVSASPSYNPHAFVSKNMELWKKLGPPVAAFIHAAQRDLARAATEYGDEVMQRKVAALGQTVSVMFQASMGSATMALSNAGGDRPAVMFYHPFTDLLMLTSWTWEGKITDCHFTSGNFFLGTDEPVSIPFYNDFREEKNQLGRAILLTSRVKKKFLEVYPGLAAAPVMEVRDMPVGELARKVSLLAGILAWEDKSETQRATDLLQEFQDTWVKGDLQKLEGLIAKDSHLKAADLALVPASYRNLVVIHGIEPPGKPRYVLMADPELPSVWYDLVIGVEGIVLVNAIADLSLTTAQPK